MSGGTFQNFIEKSYLKLTDEQIQKHLDGFHHIGIYPLIQDNTTWFLTADFDKANWHDEAVTFLNACQEKEVPAYLEPSHSGNGGHVWIFFDKPYPVIRRRKIFSSILEQSGAFSMFDKSSSFDRLFPNQDFLSEKGFGNLIALPLFKPTFDPPIATDDKLNISLNNNIRISGSSLTPALINFLKEELNFANSEFFIKKKSGRNTYETDRYFKLVEETESEIFIPRGFIGRLLRFCKESQIEFGFVDARKLNPSISYVFNASLRNHQLGVIEAASKKDYGVIVAPPGSEKTVIGLKIITDKRQPALIIVHRKQFESIAKWNL